MKLDEIGPWSEVKLQILKEYAKPYSDILTARGFAHDYIDAFAGAGVHKRKVSGEMIAGSPLNALLVQPPFDKYHLIDLDGEKIDNLKAMAGDRTDVAFYNEDCNQVLLKLLPDFEYRTRKRALCILDPYKLTLNWDVVKMAGKLGSVEVFINFPVMQINRNLKKPSIADINPGELAQMDAFWGDRTWHDALYRPTSQYGLGLFDLDPDKQSNDDLVAAYRDRLINVAGFKCVPEPMPMRLGVTKGPVIYYLFFASPNPTGKRIVEDIFCKWRNV